MKTKASWALAGFCCAMMCAPHCSATTLPPPNIIFILTDDQGYGDMGRTGHPILKTPNFDSIYDQSVRFRNFSVSPSCAPTRTSLLTGMHPFKSGVTHTLPPREHASLDRTLLPQILKTAGYKTAHFGKWHLGDSPGYNPWERGFDLAVGIRQAQVVGPEGGFFDPVVTHNGKNPTKHEGYREDVLFDEAMRFIGHNKGSGPLFLYICPWSPHDPLIAPEEDILPYREKVDEKTAAFYGMIANLDKNLGRLVDKLEEWNLLENTVLVLMNDNGGTYGVDVHNAGMRGIKTSSWLGGYRAFSLWQWANHWPPRNVDALADAADVLPTFAQIAGAVLPQEVKDDTDGVSLLPLLENHEAAWDDDRFIFIHGGRWASGLASLSSHTAATVRWKNFILVRREPSEDPENLSQEDAHAINNHLLLLQRGKNAGPYTTNSLYHWGLTRGWELYDVFADPGCRKDLAAQMPETVQRLSTAYDAWWEDVLPMLTSRGGDRSLDYLKRQTPPEPSR
jgi:arylsulfatase A-like enzyme